VDALERSRRDHVAVEPKFQPSNVSVRVKISALWVSLLFVFAYVDLFSLYRADFRADIEAGEIAGFTINEAFLFGTTLYVVLPSLMVFFVLVLKPSIARIANIVLAILYAITVVAGAVGEWGYYIFGSVVEIALLATIVYYCRNWPKLESLRSPTTPKSPAHDV
jgi:hypothetical protein